MSEYRSYTEQMTVLDGDSDFRCCLKPSALFRYVEQVSADHARAYGMDHAFFRERHSAFLVGKQALRVWRMPGRAEKINLTTACEAFKKGTMKRLTTITSETGEKLALVDCRWMIVDTEAGRILRTPGWTMPDFQNDDLPEELPQIVHKSQPLTAAGERRASYSMCDLNGHINNSLYLDIACDALPQEVVEAAPLSFASIKYHREVPMGQTVQVFYAPSGNGWYLLGRREEHAAFECYLEFGYREGKTLLDHEIFFFLFFGISGVRHPPPAVLLHSCRPTPHRRYSASCAKEPVWFRTGSFASKNPEKSSHSEGKYDLRSICLFFCKGHLQSLARQGFVFRVGLG